MSNPDEYRLRFNTLLEEVGLDPDTVKLVRHRNKKTQKNAPYDLWRIFDGRFEIYQSLQRIKDHKAEAFDGAQYIASFVVDGCDTLFVGVYSIDGKDTVPEGTICPVKEESVDRTHVRYPMTKTNFLSAYEGKLVIDWGEGTRSWVQWAGKNDKPIIEIRRIVHEHPFPGYLKFHCEISKIDELPSAWREHLAKASGVYLLVCQEKDCGKQYVGKADGERGFLGRWEQYQKTGDGGNEGMKKHFHHDNYVARILEVASSPELINDLETRWKEVLGTRDFGLNEN